MDTVEQVLIAGDLSKLNTTDRVLYYKAVCESVGLNPLTKPFEYITLNGKLTLYARRDATDQLRSINKVSIEILSRETVEDCYVVTARATTPIRQDESIGAVSIAGLKGEAKANAMMKAETKAKRRVTLSVCGLGMLDELEVDTIPGARITPSSGVQERLSEEQATMVAGIADKVLNWLADGSVGDAVAELDNAALDADEKVFCWTFFDSKQRRAMKDENERQKAERAKAALPPPEVISAAQKKRLEARIGELGLDRTLVKGACVEQYGKAHFSELTLYEYDQLDSRLEVMPKAAPQQPIEVVTLDTGLHPVPETAAAAAPNADEALLIKAEEFASCGTERYKAWWLSITEQQRKAIGEARHNTFKKIAAEQA
jgi:hypothetical protein